MTIAEAIDRLERRYMTMSMGFIGDEGKEICKRENEAITMAINALRRHNLMKPAEGPPTNANRIRSMTDEELAEYLIRDVEAEAIRRAGRYLTNIEIDRAVVACLDWLQSLVGGDGDG